MTDSSSPQIRRGSPRSNPAPRRALPRVTPLGPAGELLGEIEHHDAATPAESQVAATGRDLLIPSGSEQTRRKGRASATVPSVAELMPPPEQPVARGRTAPAPSPVELTRAEQPRGNDGAGRATGKGKHPKGKADAGQAHHGAKQDHGAKPDQGAKQDHGAKDASKEVALQVALSKGLRKRLKSKAADMGLSPEAAVAQLVEVWVDG